MKGAESPKRVSYGQGRTWSGSVPAAKAPAAVTILKVEPGAYSPRRARSKPVGLLATARTAPVRLSMATRATGRATSAMASSAARWVA